MNNVKGNRNPLSVLGAVAVLLVLVCCVCSATAALLTFDSVGGLWEAITRLFRRGDAGGITLYSALRNGTEAAFRLGEGCDYTFTQGSVVSSALETEGGNGFAGDMTREQVIETVTGALQEELFWVQDGAVRLESGLPVNTSLLDENRVSMSFGQQIGTGEGTTNRSLDGVVEGNQFTGSYHLDQNVSTVENGQGVERAVTAAADLSCQLQWVGE